MSAWRLVFIWHEGAAVFRLDSQHVEIIAGDYLCEELFSLAARAAHVYWRECVGEDIRKRFVFFTVVDEIEMRGRKGPRILGISSENRNKLSGTVNRQWRKQECAHDAEDCGIGAYTKRQ